MKIFFILLIVSTILSCSERPISRRLIDSMNNIDTENSTDEDDSFDFYVPSENEIPLDEDTSFVEQDILLDQDLEMDDVQNDEDIILPEYCHRTLSRDYACNENRPPNWIDVEFAEDRYNSTCYDEWDFDKEFVDRHLNRVGTLVMDNGGTNCSGQLITEDLFITAAHCIGYSSNWNGKPTGIAAGLNQVTGINFSYQVNSEDGELRDFAFYPIKSTFHEDWGESWGEDDGMEDFGLVEYGWFKNPPNPLKGLEHISDFAIIRLGKNEQTGKLPGNDTNTFNGKIRGWNEISVEPLKKDDQLLVIGHPQALAKVVDAGLFDEYSYGEAFKEGVSIERMLIKNLDLAVGSSGSGVLTSDGKLHGLVVWSECFNEPDKTENMRHITTSIIEACKVSDIIKDLTGDPSCGN